MAADYGDRRGAHALLLRREHERPRVPARLPGGDRAHPPGRGRARDPGPRQRLRGRLGRGGAGAGRRDPADRAGAAGRQGGERLDPDARGAGPLLPAAQRGLRAAPGGGGGADRGARRRPEGRRPPGRSCSTPPARPVPCAWRFPGVGTALAGALFLHRRFTVQSGGAATRRVDWAQSSALLVRREAAAAVGYLDPAFFVYYDECDFAKRLAERRLALRSSSPPPRPSTTTSSPPTSPRACRASSNSTATATSTCESTTAAARRWRCAA